jgi:hypothetical protein
VATRMNPISLGDTGERIVANELRQRGFRVHHLGPRAHDWDLVAEKDGRKHKIQVKTIGSGSWQCGVATKYIKINLIDEKQWVTGKQPLSDPDGIYIFMNLEGQRTFYLTTAREVQDLVFSEYKANLRRHHRRRPKNPYSFHHGTTMAKLVRWKNNWRILSK